MKFVSAALLLLGAISTESKKVLNKKSLMKNAIPVKNGKPVARKLDEDDEFEITGKHSIQFNDCISLKVNDEDVFDEDLYQYTYNGQIVAQKSYVLFNVCETEYCGYDAYDMQYMVDLATYVGALVEYIPNKKEEFCEACNEFEDYCNPEEEEGEDEEEGDEEEEEDEDGDERRLAKKKRPAFKVPKRKKNRKLANYIDCDECLNQGCYNEDEDEGDDAVQEEDVVGWIQEMAECKETESAWGDFQLYTGFMCNSDRDGVEIGVFLDEDCSMYTNQKSFANLMDEDDEIYYYESGDLVTYPFTTDIDCAGEVEYDDPDEDEDENGDENEDEEEEAEANEVCQNLLDEDALDLETCGADGDEEEEEDEDEDNEDAVYYDWYTFDIEGEDAEEPETVCKFLQEWDGEEYEAVYDQDSSGGFYDYTTYDGDENQESSRSTGASMGMIAGIIAIIVAVAVAAVFAVKSMSKKKATDDKKEPLTKKSGGAMA